MKDIKGYEGLYAVTSCGKVWSYKSKRFLNIARSSNGYMNVALYKNGTRKQYSVHRLVAKTFMPNPNNLPEVNHKDENKSHNWINNLEWCDKKYNANYGTRNDRLAKVFGIPVYCVELDRVFESAHTAARILNLNVSHINECCNGIHKKTGGYHFKFVEEVGA